MKSFSDKLKFLFSFLGITFVILLFQNCGVNSFRAGLPSSIEQLSENSDGDIANKCPVGKCFLTKKFAQASTNFFIRSSIIFLRPSTFKRSEI